MQLQTLARDCLYLNWALPLEAAPRLPEPLRYEVHGWEGRDHVFASALLFQLDGLHLTALPFLRITYPQMNLRLYVRDGDGVPSVLFLRMLVPLWVVPVSRLLARQPAQAARLVFPSPSRGGEGEREEGGWFWSIRRRGALHVVARLDSPQVHHGPSLGSWDDTVGYFRHRNRGYVLVANRLRSIKTFHPSIELWPLAVEVPRAGLVARCLDRAPADLWQHPHSAWLCPQIPFRFELSKARRLQLAGRQVPAPGC